MEFDDPRPAKAGPLPHSRGKYTGLYLHGPRVIFAYHVQGCDILDSPSLIDSGGAIFVRSFTVSPCAETLYLRLADRDQNQAAAPNGQPVRVVVAGDLKGLAVEASPNSSLTLIVPPHPATEHFGVALCVGPTDAATPDILRAIGHSPDLGNLRSGGPARWQQTTQGWHLAALLLCR